MRLPLAGVSKHHRLSLKPKMASFQFPSLPEVSRLTPSCIRILAGNPSKFTLQGTNTYLLGTGPKRLLIDTGEGKPSWIAALKRTLAEENASIQDAIITHWHHDHVGGISDILAAWPGIKLHKHQPNYQNPEKHPFLPISDGQLFSVSGAELKAVHTPGHTIDHMVLFWVSENAMFTGDNVLGHGTAVFEDLSTYLASLQKMRSLSGFTGQAYPGHGPVVENGQAKIKEYIQHRQQREDQVVQFLSRPGAVDASANTTRSGSGSAADGGGWEVMEMVRSIYRDIPENLHLPAAGGVVQILRKLQREGRVQLVFPARDGEPEKWRLVSSTSSPGRESVL
ncbi:hypothetical protein QBC35DRAFT_497754 [Podospora australis]|uniref:Metallo-beta-lactamase domain-containing protein n=1 Tax=Podospora australis TaxID=1536484 RepID=A0AAN6WT22_9PEZI|nr:hypothetical protein QBC35DRAFT_497754 [Podospora australis]